MAYLTDQITAKVAAVLKKKHKEVGTVKPHMIRNNLWVFVNCLIDNPAFDSQTKESLTTRPAKFGSVCELPDKLLKEIAESGVVETVANIAKAKEQTKMARALGGGKKKRLLGIPKLEEANLAGSKHSEDCIIILTEGDSAKSLAMSGIEIVGRDRYGVFPLRGKFLNVREAGSEQIMKNAEV